MTKSLFSDFTVKKPPHPNPLPPQVGGEGE